MIKLLSTDEELKSLDIGLVNARLLCPIDEKLLSILDGAEKIITVEDGNADTGFGAQVSRLMCSRKNPPRVLNIGVPNIPIEAATIPEQDDFCGLSPEKLKAAIMQFSDS